MAAFLHQIRSAQKRHLLCDVGSGIQWTGDVEEVVQIQQNRLCCKHNAQFVRIRHHQLTVRACGNVFFFWRGGQRHHMSFVDFVVLPPGHGRSVTDFWDWDAHEARLRCTDGVCVVIEEDVVPGGALNLNSTNLPRPWSPWESSPSREIPTVEPGIETGTSWLVVRDSDH